MLSYGGSTQTASISQPVASAPACRQASTRAFRSCSQSTRGDRMYQCAAAVAGTMFGADRPRLVEIDGVAIEATPAGHLLVMRNQDVPGVIGQLGTILGEAGINIAGLKLGRIHGTDGALSIIDVDGPVPRPVVDRIRAIDQIVAVEIRVRIIAEETIFQYAQIEKIDDTVLVQVGITGIGDAIPVRVTQPRPRPCRAGRGIIDAHGYSVCRERRDSQGGERKSRYGESA